MIPAAREGETILSMTWHLRQFHVHVLKLQTDGMKGWKLFIHHAIIAAKRKHVPLDGHMLILLRLARKEWQKLLLGEIAKALILYTHMFVYLAFRDRNNSSLKPADGNYCDQAWCIL